MIKEYDIIKSLSDLNEKVLIGCKGTVLLVYPNSPPAYEVEFVDQANKTLDVLTVRADDIIKIAQ